MFAILEILPKDTSSFAKLRERFHPPEIFLEEVKGEGFTRYYIIRAQERSSGIPWEEIENIAGRCKKRLLVQKNIELPRDSGLCAFYPEKYPALILFNTAAEILKRLRKELPLTSCLVVDKKGNAVKLIEKLVPYASALKVYTLNTALYSGAAAEIFERFGASICVSDEKQILDKNLLTVSLDSDPSLFPVKGFTITYRRQKDSRTFSPGKITLPGEYYLPPIEGISRFDFMAALYELSSARGLEKLYADTLFYSSREISLNSAAALIAPPQ